MNHPDDYLILRDDECPDIECEGHLIYNTKMDLCECTGCDYCEDTDEVKELV